MKSRFFVNLCLILTLSLLFSSFRFEVVYAAVQDDSAVVFGITPQDVIDKYNSLTPSQKEQVNKSLGNTSIFANSLFGNVLSTSFGVLSDAVDKLGDLFFKTNGVVYNLGVKALSWISHLIDRVLDNDFDDLNISQPVIDDIYINTSGLSYLESPLFTNGHLPSFLDGWAIQNHLPFLPVNFEPYIIYSAYHYWNTDRAWYYLNNRGTFIPNSSSSLGSFYGLFVNLNSNHIFLGYAELGSSESDFAYLSSIKEPTVNNYYGIPFLQYGYNSPLYGSSVGYYAYSSSTSSYPSNFSVSTESNKMYLPPIVGFSGTDYLGTLSSYLSTYFYHIDRYFLVQGNKVYVVPIDHEPSSLNVTNNTYYNYIYNIPDMTPLNPVNIVSNTSIEYSPVENINYYVQEGYNITQNFTLVENYYISSGSAISGSSIDVTVVSPGVFDVRVVNPQDFSTQVINENNQDIINNYDFNFGDLDLTVGVGSGLSSANDSLTPSITSGASIIVGFVSGFPPDIAAVIFGLLGIAIISGVIYRVTSG